MDIFRVFLTQESVYTQLLAVEVVKAVLLAGKDCLQQDRTKIKGTAHVRSELHMQ